MLELCYYKSGEKYKETKCINGEGVDTFGKTYHQGSGEYINVVSYNNGVTEKRYYILDPCSTLFAGKESKYNHILDDVKFPRKDLATFVSIETNGKLCDVYFSTENYEDVVEISKYYNLEQPLSQELILDFNENKENWVYNIDTYFQVKTDPPTSYERPTSFETPNPKFSRRFFAMSVKYDEEMQPSFMKIYKRR